MSKLEELVNRLSEKPITYRIETCRFSDAISGNVEFRVQVTIFGNGDYIDVLKGRAIVGDEGYEDNAYNQILKKLEQL
jgi:hypothetical protein